MSDTFVPAKIRAKKIVQGLYYLCDKPYERGHKCGFKEPQLFTIEILTDEEDEGNKFIDEEYNCAKTQEIEEPYISLHTLIREQSFLHHEGCWFC